MRKQFNEIFVGTNGTGKTTIMLEGVLAYTNAPANINKNILFLMPDFCESKYDDIPEIKINDLGGDFGIGKIMCFTAVGKNKSIYAELYERYALKDKRFNGLIVSDDMGASFKRRPEDIITLASRKRQLNIDFFWNFHGLTTDVPKSFWRSVSGITLFRTADDYRDTMDKISGDIQNEFRNSYFKVQAIANGKMLDEKGRETFDIKDAVYNREQLKDAYYNLRVQA